MCAILPEAGGVHQVLLAEGDSAGEPPVPRADPLTEGPANAAVGNLGFFVLFQWPLVFPKKIPELVQTVVTRCLHCGSKEVC